MGGSPVQPTLLQVWYQSRNVKGRDSRDNHPAFLIIIRVSKLPLPLHTPTPSSQAPAPHFLQPRSQAGGVFEGRGCVELRNIYIYLNIISILQSHWLSAGPALHTPAPLAAQGLRGSAGFAAAAVAAALQCRAGEHRENPGPGTGNWGAESQEPAAGGAAAEAASE